jgi:hypothetical protein
LLTVSSDSSESEIEDTDSQLDNLRARMVSLLTNHCIVTAKQHLSSAWRISYAALLPNPLSVSQVNAVGLGLMDDSISQIVLQGRTEIAKIIISTATEIAALAERRASVSALSSDEKDDNSSSHSGNEEMLAIQQ